MRVREAAVDDVDASLDLFEAVVNEGLWMGTEPSFDRAERRERFLASITTDGRVQLVAVADEGEIVGMLHLDVAAYGVAGLGMCVAQDWRGQGIGGELVDHAVAAARRMGAHKLSLQVWPHNTAARRLYRGRGFVEEGRLRRHYARRNGELWDAVMMGLVLDEERPGSTLDEEGEGA